MATIENLKPSISELTEEEFFQTIRLMREERRILPVKKARKSPSKSPKTSKTKPKKKQKQLSLEEIIMKMSPEERLAYLERLSTKIKEDE